MEGVYKVREAQGRVDKEDDRPLEEVLVLQCEELLLELDDEDGYRGKEGAGQEGGTEDQRH